MTNMNFQLSSIVFTALLLLFNVNPEAVSPMTSSTAGMNPLDATDLLADTSPASHRNYALRGDWEAPDILLVVESFEWPEAVSRIVRAARQEGTPVYVLKDDEGIQQDRQAPGTEKHNRVKTLNIAYDTPWIRDYGPIQIRSGGDSIHWLDFEYTGNRPYDDSVPQQIADQLGFEVEKREYNLDGGAVISNGRGLCAITEVSLWEAQVDPSDPEEFGAFRSMLGCRTLAVIPALTGESTGHADVIAQFLSPGIVAVAMCDIDKHPLISEDLEEAVDILLSAAREAGQPLRAVRLPMHVDGEDFYSYVNGTRLRNTYLVPSFNNVPGGKEMLAYNVLKNALPGVALAPIPADYMAQKGGAVHCITLGLNLPLNDNPRQYLVKNGMKPDSPAPFVMKIKSYPWMERVGAGDAVAYGN